MRGACGVQGLLRHPRAGPLIIIINSNTRQEKYTRCRDKLSKLAWDKAGVKSNWSAASTVSRRVRRAERLVPSEEGSAGGELKECPRGSNPAFRALPPPRLPKGFICAPAAGQRDRGKKCCAVKRYQPVNVLKKKRMVARVNPPEFISSNKGCVPDFEAEGACVGVAVRVLRAAHLCPPSARPGSGGGRP